MTKANYSLRLQPSLKSAAERIASAEGTGTRAAFLAFLDGAADSPPDSTIGE